MLHIYCKYYKKCSSYITYLEHLQLKRQLYQQHFLFVSSIIQAHYEKSYVSGPSVPPAGVSFKKKTKLTCCTNDDETYEFIKEVRSRLNVCAGVCQYSNTTVSSPNILPENKFFDLVFQCVCILARFLGEPPMSFSYVSILPVAPSGNDQFPVDIQYDKWGFCNCK